MSCGSLAKGNDATFSVLKHPLLKDHHFLVYLKIDLHWLRHRPTHDWRRSPWMEMWLPRGTMAKLVKHPCTLVTRVTTAALLTKPPNLGRQTLPVLVPVPEPRLELWHDGPWDWCGFSSAVSAHRSERSVWCIQETCRHVLSHPCACGCGDWSVPVERRTLNSRDTGMDVRERRSGDTEKSLGEDHRRKEMEVEEGGMGAMCLERCQAWQGVVMAPWGEV